MKWDCNERYIRYCKKPCRDLLLILVSASLKSQRNLLPSILSSPGSTNLLVNIYGIQEIFQYSFKISSMSCCSDRIMGAGCLKPPTFYITHFLNPIHVLPELSFVPKHCCSSMHTALPNESYEYYPFVKQHCIYVK